MKMENLNGKILNNLPFKENLIKVGDLQYFDGSLMTLFENTKNQCLYLFDWANSNDIYNRWLVYSVNPKDILKYMNFEMAHLPLIQTSNDIYTVDIDKYYNYHNVTQIHLQDIPLDYLPDADIMFDLADCKDFKKIKQQLLSLIKRRDNIYKSNSQSIALNQIV